MYVQSSIPFEQVEPHRFRRLATLATFCIAISIIMWHSRCHISTSDLQSRKSGFLFPLFFSRQLPNASDELEGEMWHGSSATNSRGLQQVSHLFFKLRLVDIIVTTLKCHYYLGYHTIMSISLSYLKGSFRHYIVEIKKNWMTLIFSMDSNQ